MKAGRLKVAVAALAIAVAVGLCAAGAGAAPAGPRLAVVALQGSGKTQLLTFGPAGGGRSVVFRSGNRLPLLYTFSAPSWSPDGARLAVTVINSRHRNRYSLLPRTAIGLVGVDGGAIQILPGTATGLAPVFAPDGTRLAYAKFRGHRKPNRHGADEIHTSASIWMLDLSTGTSRRLTPWRSRLVQVPSSFSPDGSRLAFTRIVGDKPPEALAMAFDGSADSVLVRDALEPVYSPDGSRLAFLRGPVKTRRRSGSITTARLTDLYTVSSAGGDLMRLTATRDVAEEAPSWDPSGQRLAYTALKPFTSEDALYAVLGFGDQIRAINADGTCSSRIVSVRGLAFYGAAWQPGPGREAGPISC